MERVSLFLVRLIAYIGHEIYIYRYVEPLTYLINKIPASITPVGKFTDNKIISQSLKKCRIIS